MNWWQNSVGKMFWLWDLEAIWLSSAGYRFLLLLFFKIHLFTSSKASGHWRGQNYKQTWKRWKGTGPLVSLRSGLNAPSGSLKSMRMRMHKGKTYLCVLVLGFSFIRCCGRYWILFEREGTGGMDWWFDPLWPLL